MKTFKKILLIALAVVLAIILASGAIIGSMLLQMNHRTNALREDYTFLALEFPEAVSAGPEIPVTQRVSCGYAVIEMFSTWAGIPVTEQELDAQHDKVVTSTAAGFTAEMNARLPGYHTQCLTWLSDPAYLRTIYKSLEAGIPVPIQWAAQADSSWTLHYSLVTGMDLPGDRITVQNPYGYTEDLTQEEFLNRTRFDAYENMPFWLQMAFALDVFQKNALFLVTPD